jgi:hypothetical protein
MILNHLGGIHCADILERMLLLFFRGYTGKVVPVIN